MHQELTPSTFAISAPQRARGGRDPQPGEGGGSRRALIFQGLAGTGRETLAVHANALGPRGEGRARAVAADAEQGMPFPLAELWSQLRAGEWRMCDAFAEDGRWYALVASIPPASAERRSQAGFAMLEQVLLGQTSKVVAMERKLSPSAVAYAMRSALDSIGLGCRLRGVPQILMLSARLSRSPTSHAAVARIARVRGSKRDAWIISTRCPSMNLLDSLSQAERAVMLQLLEGRDYKHIASTRNTSLRTVANQVTTSFRKLGVSGRAELVDRLLQCSFGTYPSVHAQQPVKRPVQVAVPAGAAG